MSAIKCNFGFSNTGVGCIPIFSVLKKIIFVPYYDSTGVQNTVTISATLNKAYFDAKVNHTDPSKRWYPLPFMKNAKNERGESIKESFDDGSSIIVQDNIRKFSAMLVDKDASPQLEGIVKSFRATDMGFYGVDKDNNLVGVVNTTGSLDPIQLDPNSLEALFNPAMDKVVQKLSIMFDISTNEDDKNLRMITGNEMSYPVGMIKGIMDVSAVFTFPLADASSFTVELDTVAGTPKNPLTVKGLLIGDFVLNNITDPGVITITSVTEQLDSVDGSPTGIYDFVFPAQTTGDILQLIPTKAGFDFTKVSVARLALV